MNRAWIPAGALASVSVAGLIALGPLTDSMGTKVAFSVSVSTPAASTAQARAVPVSVDLGTSGNTDTENAAFTNSRGKEATPTNDDSGLVSLNKRIVAVTTQPAKPKATPAKKKKKAAPRQKSIGTYGEQNGTAGLAGGSSGSRQYGEQTQTPGG